MKCLTAYEWPVLTRDTNISNASVIRTSRIFQAPLQTPLPCFHQWVKLVLAQSSAKRPTFAFVGESGYSLGSAQRIANKGTHGKTGVVSGGGGIITLGALCALPKRWTTACQSGLFAVFLRPLCSFWPRRWILPSTRGWVTSITNCRSNFIMYILTAARTRR